jgi:NADPH:quinone reductase-like Zn-dependent oxidoreductase
MKAYVIGDQTGLASLRLTDKPDPVPAPGEAIVQVRMVCLGHRDLSIVSGTYGARRAEDRVPLSEGVGVVIALGVGVTGVAIGDRVICAHFANWIDGAFSPAYFGSDLGVTRDGWLAEAVAVPAIALIKVPDAVPDTQVGTLVASGVTAWNALIEFGRLKTGETVLTLGTGGVSITALQIAKAAGARVAITSSSDEKLARARDLGADITINYRTTPDWPAALLAATGGNGADIVVETGGFATLTQSIAAAAAGGRIAIIGALAGNAADGLPNYGSIIGKNLIIGGIASGSRAMLARLLYAAEVNNIVPVIDSSFAFADAPAAYTHLKSGTHLGKVVITL